METFRFKLWLATLLLAGPLLAQQNDSTALRSIHDEILVRGQAYDNLRVLCKEVGARLSGSPQAEKAVAWGLKAMKAAGADTAWLQPVMVPRWERGNAEQVALGAPGEKLKPIKALALGGSVATNGRLKGQVVLVESLEALKALPPFALEGKIAFLAQAMDPRMIDTFRAYGGCSSIRVSGASEAASKGAIALVIRSLTLNHDSHPHTGVVIYKDSLEIPCAALANNVADALEADLQKGQTRLMTMELFCKTLPDVQSYNVIGEIKGTDAEPKIIAVGGHLDSWDVGEGAHDDGAGCVQAIEVLRCYKALQIQPRNTIRAVLFMNEENGNRGGKEYARVAKERGEVHLAALESDRGGFSPRGFSVDATRAQHQAMAQWLPLLQPYLLHLVEVGFGGVDISPLRNGQTALIGLVPDSQRYFDFHHAETDVFENVHPRELHLGAAALASLIYLINQHGLPTESVDP